MSDVFYFRYFMHNLKRKLLNFNFNHSKPRIMAMLYFMKEENEKSLKKNPYS